jgi:hypothetical protein
VTISIRVNQTKLTWAGRPDDIFVGSLSAYVCFLGLVIRFLYDYLFCREVSLSWDVARYFVCGVKVELASDCGACLQMVLLFLHGFHSNSFLETNAVFVQR